MAVLRDEGLWAALQSMLDNSAGKHTVESLAETAGMSRSTFAARFSQAYGEGPMVLLRNSRMTFAASLLKKSKTPIERISVMSDFESRSAFSRAFKVATGVSPAEFRKSN